MNKYEIKTTIQNINEKTIIHNDYMYPIFTAINEAYGNDWNKDNINSWTHQEIGKLYKITIIGKNIWINLEYPEGILIDMSEDGMIESTPYNYGPSLKIIVPKNWNHINLNIDDKRITLKRIGDQYDE